VNPYFKEFTGTVWYLAITNTMFQSATQFLPLKKRGKQKTLNTESAMFTTKMQCRVGKYFNKSPISPKQVFAIPLSHVFCLHNIIT